MGVLAMVTQVGNERARFLLGHYVRSLHGGQEIFITKLVLTLVLARLLEVVFLARQGVSAAPALCLFLGNGCHAQIMTCAGFPVKHKMENILGVLRSSYQ